MIRKLLLIVSILTLYSFSAKAATYYYSQLTVNADDNGIGEVYVSTKNVAAPDYGATSTASNNTSSILGWSSTSNHTYYVYARSKDINYVFDSWTVVAGNATVDGTKDPAVVTIAAGKNNQNNPTSATLKAVFKPRTENMVMVYSNDEKLGTATLTGTNTKGGTVKVTAAYLYNIPKGDYWNYFSKSVKFEGWYDQDGNLRSEDMVYTFTVEEPLDLTARFTWTPFITQADGYYFVRSAIGTNGRGYVNVVADYAPSFTTSNRSLAGAMEMVFDDTYISDPACVLLISGTNYTNHENYTKQATILKNVELVGQGISTKSLTGQVFQVRTGDQQGFYKLYYSSANLYNAYNGSLTISSDQTGKTGEIMRLFDFEPLDEDHIDEFYFGAKADDDMLYQEGYWTSMYTAFPYEIYDKDNTEAYYISEVSSDGSETVAQLEKIESGIVPAYTAVLLKCGSTDPAENRLLPLLNEPAPLDGNLLQGSLQLNSKTKDKVKFNGAEMRVLSVINGEVGFYKLAENTELTANKAWLQLPAGTANAAAKVRLSFGDASGIEDIAVDESANDADGFIYNLQGIRVPNTTPGQIYIKNGKKFIAR